MKLKSFRHHLLILGLLVIASGCAEKEVRAQILSLRIVPEKVTVWGEHGSQHFLVLARYPDGLERDATSSSHLSLSAPERGAIDAEGTFTAKTNGDATLTGQFDGQAVKATIHVQGVGEPRPFSFARDIGGILTRRGCNDASCHGSVKGRNGFKLSVYAQSPRDDYKAIVEGETFRVLTTDTNPKRPRINLKEPEKSLVLLKPTLSVPHGSGLRFEAGSPDYEKILNWIRAGVPYGVDDETQSMALERVEVFPKQLVLDVDGREQLLVTAYLANGRSEDITGEARYVSADPGIVEVNDSGMIEARKAGETNVFVQAAGGHALSITVGVVKHPIPNYPKVETRNYIDEFVFTKLRKVQILPSELSTDQEFLRRVCLDLTGTLPPPERVRTFLADRDPSKRDVLIERLLNSPEYVDYWSFRFGDLMRVNFEHQTQDPRMTQAFQDWIADSIASNKPYDQMARERIAAQGYAAPARSYYYVTELYRPEVIMPELVRVFWGQRIECAQCHNHPFESWSQNQFWGLAAFFGGITELSSSKVVFDSLGGGHVDQPRDMTVVHPRTKERVVPAFLDGTTLPQDQWMDPRKVFADWMTSHPHFAEASVNRIWGYFFGRGLVDPVDDFRTTNPPTHPELLQALAKDFRDTGYDLKRLMRTIVQSRTYQLSATPNETNRDDRTNYSRSQPRALEAAFLLDAISSATGVPEEFKYLASMEAAAPPPEAWAVQMLPDITPSHFQEVFGRCTRNALPSGHAQPSLPQALHILAGSTYTSKISKEGGRLDRLLKRGTSDEEIIEELYLASLTRWATPEEKEELLRFLAQRTDRRRQTFEGLLWALVSSREFAYNH